ncbi:hypothetical protein ACX7S9_001932 [Morganella morganii]|uniref:hypothetical protein n=1 Tax=Morganella morganii TaxID=582 RepID=UPI0013302AC3|nr:hypothetical protein [Morganella morganii]EJD6109793.1 hypothetical protein [Morganella morganii]EJG2208198.1 hypothetical protein [Morganella morganii]EKU4014408.1 hypothetical protein [Morganella morganii]ELA7702299.1 hypothetical protein [Morganella morganii]EMB8446616.1 hypothetical protein [Morganella morganii]
MQQITIIFFHILTPGKTYLKNQFCHRVPADTAQNEKALSHPYPPGVPIPGKNKTIPFKPGRRDNRQSGKTLTHPCSLGSRHPWRFTLSFFCRLIPCVPQLCQKQKNRKTEKQKNRKTEKLIC